MIPFSRPLFSVFVIVFAPYGQGSALVRSFDCSELAKPTR
jgi:hypothetical protein